jgi:hypothetical protein
MTTIVITGEDRKAIDDMLADDALRDMETQGLGDLPDWYRDQKQLERRRAMALEARAAQKLAAATVSTAAEPTVRSQHEGAISGVETALQAIMALAEDANLEHARKQIVRGICSNVDWLMGDTENRLANQAERIAELQRRHRGAEVDDTRLQRALEWAQKLETQHDFYADVMEAAIGVLDYLGESWTRRPKAGAEWTTGARLSSVLFGCRLCDLVLTANRCQITFRATKNGDDVTATLHPAAVAVRKEYLSWRGILERREDPLFLTDRRQPYSRKGRERGWSGGNKTAFRRARRRAVFDLIRLAVQARRAGDAARAGQLKADAKLLHQVTQHWLRHWFATHAMAAAMPLRLIMEQAG